MPLPHKKFVKIPASRNAYNREIQKKLRQVGVLDKSNLFWSLSYVDARKIGVIPFIYQGKDA